MHCPFCQTEETKVIDSRLVDEGSQVRRRRECLQCSERFTTFETPELVMPHIIKRDGVRRPFDIDKLKTSFHKALEKRPISVDEVDIAINHVVQRIRKTGERELSSQLIGEYVMDELRGLDQVAYVRFASVYRSFQDVNAFNEEIEKLRGQVDE